MVGGNIPYSYKNYRNSERANTPEKINKENKNKVLSQNAMSCTSARTVEMVLRINMQDREPQAITVFQGDKAEDLAAKFCDHHKISDSSRKRKLKKIVES